MKTCASCRHDNAFCILHGSHIAVGGANSVVQCMLRCVTVPPTVCAALCVVHRVRRNAAFQRALFCACLHCTCMFCTCVTMLHYGVHRVVHACIERACIVRVLKCCITVCTVLCEPVLCVPVLYVHCNAALRCAPCCACLHYACLFCTCVAMLQYSVHRAVWACRLPLLRTRARRLRPQV